MPQALPKIVSRSGLEVAVRQGPPVLDPLCRPAGEPAQHRYAPSMGRAGAVLATAILSLIAVFGFSGAAQASADKCRGDASSSCVAVNGKGLHVNWIKSRVAPYSKLCVYGHSQVLINGRHYADSNGGKDKSYCGTSYLGSQITTGTWNVNTNYKKGTSICSKFWVYTGNGPVNGYRSLGTACATVG